MDNLVAEDARTLADLGVTATSFHSVVPGYLCRHRPGGMYNPRRAWSAGRQSVSWV